MRKSLIATALVAMSLALSALSVQAAQMGADRHVAHGVKCGS